MAYVDIRPDDFATIRAKLDGWSSLISSPNSRALDYIRSRVLHPPIMIWNVRYDSFLSHFLNFIRWNPPWKNGTGIQALTDLEEVIAQGVRFYIFGERLLTAWRTQYPPEPGDPIGGGHDVENGIWQDDGTIIETAQGNFLGFLNKFKT